MFLPIYFKSLKGLSSIYQSLEGILEEQGESDCILIQDSSDMKIEKVTKKQLYEYESKYGIDVGSISCLECNRASKEVLGVYNDYLDVFSYGHWNKTYLEGKFSCNDDKDLNEEQICKKLGIEYDINNFYEVGNINFSYKGNSFKLTLFGWSNSKSDSVKMYLLVNNKIFCEIRGMGETYFGDLYLYLNLAQVCKTKNGFEFVFSFCSEHSYIGVKLNDELSILGMFNLGQYIKSTSKSDSSFKEVLAKMKMLGI